MWAVAAVAGLGMVAAMMFKIWADCRPAAVVSRLISGPRTWVCLRLLETIFNQAG